MTKPAKNTQREECPGQLRLFDVDPQIAPNPPGPNGHKMADNPNRSVDPAS